MNDTTSASGNPSCLRHNLLERMLSLIITTDEIKD